jgi:hypothetical protein
MATPALTHEDRAPDERAMPCQRVIYAAFTRGLCCPDDSGVVPSIAAIGRETLGRRLPDTFPSLPATTGQRSSSIDHSVLIHLPFEASTRPSRPYLAGHDGKRMAQVFPSCGLCEPHTSTPLPVAPPYRTCLAACAMACRGRRQPLHGRLDPHARPMNSSVVAHEMPFR